MPPLVLRSPHNPLRPSSVQTPHPSLEAWGTPRSPSPYPPLHPQALHRLLPPSRLHIHPPKPAAAPRPPSPEPPRPRPALRVFSWAWRKPTCHPLGVLHRVKSSAPPALPPRSVPAIAAGHHLRLHYPHAYAPPSPRRSTSCLLPIIASSSTPSASNRPPLLVLHPSLHKLRSKRCSSCTVTGRCPRPLYSPSRKRYL